MIRRTGIGYYLIISILLISLCSSSSVHAMRRDPQLAEAQKRKREPNNPPTSTIRKDSAEAKVGGIKKKKRKSDNPPAPTGGGSAETEVSTPEFSEEVLLCIIGHALPEGRTVMGLTCHRFRNLTQDRQLLEKVECTWDVNKLETITNVINTSLTIIPLKVDVLRLGCSVGKRHTGYVTKHLDDLALDKVTHLKNIRVLDVSGNKQECIEGEPDITTLYPGSHYTYPSYTQKPRVCSKLDITNSGLRPLGQLEHLEVLSLGNTKITDEGLKYLKGLPKLVVLSLFNTRVGGRKLRPLKDFPHLETLILSYTKVNDACLEAVGSIEGLKFLVLASTLITDEGLRHLANNRNLEALDLSFTGITDEGLEFIRDIDEGLRRTRGEGFRVLVLNETKITNIGLITIGLCKDLMVLQLALTGIDDEGLRNIGELSHLVALKLDQDGITGEGLSPTYRFPNLRSLSMIETCPNHQGLENIGEFTNLTVLNLNHALVDDINNFRFLHHLENLEELSMACATPEIPLDLDHLKDLPKLRVLDIDSAQISSSLGGLRDLTRLEELYAQNTVLSREIADIYLLLNHPNLEYIGIFDDELTNDAFFSIFKKLRKIYRGISSENDKAHIELAHNKLKNLRKIILESNDRVLKGTLLKLINYISSGNPSIMEADLFTGEPEEFNNHLLELGLRSYS